MKQIYLICKLASFASKRKDEMATKHLSITCPMFSSNIFPCFRQLEQSHGTHIFTDKITSIHGFRNYSTVEMGTTAKHN